MTTFFRMKCATGFASAAAKPAIMPRTGRASGTRAIPSDRAIELTAMELETTESNHVEGAGQ